MRQRLFPIFVLLVAAMLGGCGSQEPPVHHKTVSEIDAEIKKVQNEVNMPPQAKGMALNSLQKQREIAAKSEPGIK